MNIKHNKISEMRSMLNSSRKLDYLHNFEWRKTYNLYIGQWFINESKKYTKLKDNDEENPHHRTSQINL